MSNKIDAVMRFSVPDEMTEMTPEDYAKYFRPSNEEKYGFINKEKHTVLAILYKKRPLLLGRAATLDACLKATEKKVRKMIPSYRNTGYGSRNVDGEEAKTFRFEYTVGDIGQAGEYVLCRFTRFDCSFELICRDDFLEFGRQKADELLASVRFIK